MNKWVVQVDFTGLQDKKRFREIVDMVDLESAIDSTVASLDLLVDKLESEYNGRFAYEIVQNSDEFSAVIWFFMKDDLESILEHTVGCGFIERDK